VQEKKKRRKSKAADKEESVETGEPAAKRSKTTKESKGAPFSGRQGLRTGAKEELKIEHELSSPPDLRDHGEFTDDEGELLRRQIKAYMYEWGLSTGDMVRLIQWVRPTGENKGQNGSTEQQTRQLQVVNKFWEEMYNTLPLRKAAKKGGTTAIARYVRRKYHDFEKGEGGWDAEEDKLLAEFCPGVSRPLAKLRCVR
jgi:hypothetical protein